MLQLVKQMTKKNYLKIVSMDPSMSNWGLAIAYVYLDSDEIEVDELHVISPYKESEAKTVRQNSKDIRIAEQLIEGIIPHLEDADLIIAEVPVGSQSSRAMVSYAMCVTIIAAINNSFLKVIEVTPKDVKLNVSNNATKAQMIEWASKKHPEAPWQYKTVKGKRSIVSTHAEHVADAIGALYAALKTPEVKNLINSIKRLHK